MSMPRSIGAHAGVVVLMLAVALALRPLPTMAEDADADANAKWSIAIYAGASPFVLGPIEGVRTPVLTAADVPAFPTRIVADPFLARSGGTWFLFFEAVNEQSGHGDIAYATSTDGLTWTYGGVALNESFHLSYPYVFEWQGSWYMVPETHLGNDVRLYRAVSFPSQWVLDTTLVSGRPYVDPSLVRFGGRWWLFASTNTDLYLFSAPDLRGPYTAHPQSPVVQGDATRARPGGRLLVHGGQLFRFAQDDAERYGRQVRAFEITTLTPTSYAEVEVPESPVVGAHGCGWARDGMHTVDPIEVEPGLWLASVDGRGEPTSSEGLPKSAWRVHAVDSERPPAGAANHAFDDRCDTAWRTAPGRPPPHELVIDLAGRYTLDAVRYWAPTDPSGRIGAYELYVSEDGLTWGPPVATGTFTDTAAGQLVAFQPKTGTFLRLRALSEVNGGVEVGTTELDVFGATAVGNQAPESVIAQPVASAVTIDVGSTVTFAGGGFDPDGNLPLSFHWSFGVGSGVPDSLDQDPGPVRFDVPGVFTVTLIVTDALGLADPAPTTRTVGVVDPATAMPARDWSGAFTAWWGLDEAANGARINNAGGSSCGGTPSNCTLTNVGSVGLDTVARQQGTGAAGFDGVSRLTDTEAVYQPSGAVTFGGWVRITDETTNRVAVHRRQFSTTGYELTYVQISDRLTCKAQDKSVAITDANTAGTYAFAVCTWDGANLRAYGNGRAPTSIGLTALTPGTAAFSLGQAPVGAGGLVGQLDEIGFVNGRALSDAEICRWCSCGIQGELCPCSVATPTQYLTTGRNAAACHSCVLPACNAPAPGVPDPTPTATATPATPMPTSTATATVTAAPTVTVGATLKATVTPTRTATPTPSVTPASTRTATPTPTRTGTPTVTTTPTATATPLPSLSVAYGIAVLDGDASEFAASPAVVLVGDVFGTTGTYRCLWDATYFACSGVSDDAKLSALQTVTNASGLWADDTIELWIDTTRGRASTMQSTDYHIFVNIRNTVGTYRADTPVTLAGFESAATRHGTLNDPTDVDAGYVIEWRVPWSSLGVTPSPGMIMGFNVALDDRTTTGYDQTSWTGAFNSPAGWGQITLSSPPTPTVTATPTHTATPIVAATATHTATPTLTPTVTPPLPPTPTAGEIEAPTATPTLLPLCAPTPQAGCKTPSVAQKSTLTMRDKNADKNDTLIWQWLKGSPTTKSDFGAPDVATDYALCIYNAGSPRRLALSANIPAGGMCGAARSKPCWKATRTGFQYKDSKGASYGVRSILVREGMEPGKAKIVVLGKGAPLNVPSLLTLVPPLTVQLANTDGRCWEATYSFPTHFDSSRFNGKADPTPVPRARRTPRPTRTTTPNT